MIQTSYFANWRNFPEGKKKISISRFTPKWFKEDYNALELAPSADLLRKYKDGLVDDSQYEEIYKKETLDKLDPKEIAKKYKNAIFLCYESDNEFCHRQLVANWLIKNNIPVEEVKNSIVLKLSSSEDFNNYEYFEKVLKRFLFNYKNVSIISDSQHILSFISKYPKDLKIIDADLFSISDIGILFWNGDSKEIANLSNFAKKTYIAEYNIEKVYIST